MTPFQYLEKYHNLVISDARQGINVIANIQNYRPMLSKDEIKKPEDRWAIPAAWQREQQNLKDAVARGLKLRAGQGIPAIFTLDDDRIGPSQVFYRQSIRRAFDGRASPDDMVDVVRLAVWGGRCKAHEAGQYAQKWFGQDCNAFVSNYQGVAPYFSIAAFAHGYPWKPSPATPDVLAARGDVPLPLHTDFDAIQSGDVLATYGAADGGGNHWRHIALVESWTPSGSAQGDEVTGELKIAEWGNKGNREAHMSVNPSKKLKRGKFCPEFSKPVICCDSSMYGPNAIRIFFDASKWLKYESRGFLVAGVEGV